MRAVHFHLFSKKWKRQRQPPKPPRCMALASVVNFRQQAVELEIEIICLYNNME